MSNDKIPVLQIIKSLGRGGAETLLVETLKLHDKQRFQFHYIYFLPWKDQLVPGLASSGGLVTCYAAKNNVGLILQARKVARYATRNNIRLIHAHLPWAGILARIVGVMTGIPVIYTEHNKQERYHPATRLMNLATMGVLAHIVAVSRDVAESVARFKGKLKTPVTTILNGVNTSDFVPDKMLAKDIRTQLNIPVDAPVIGTIAVFRVQKRLDLWLEVAKKIFEKKTETHFLIVGDGPLKQVLVEKVNALGLSTQVHMVGLQTNVRPYLSSMDIYMIASIFEGLPVAMLEAMSMELPVITTNAGGIGEVITHEAEGLMCDVAEPGRLFDFAISLIENEEWRRKMATDARQKIVARFSMQRMVAELEDLYTRQLSLSQNQSQRI